MPINTKTLLDRIQNGYNPTFDEALSLLDPMVDLEGLMEIADSITRKSYDRRVGMCCIYPARVGHCGGDCAFCAQSVHNSCQIQPVRIEDTKVEYILAYVRGMKAHGVGWFSLVTSGERLSDDEFAVLVDLIKKIRRESDINLCASVGELNLKRAVSLHDAGITRYHHNIETSPSYFPKICSTHTFEEKIETIRYARQAGLEICCGGILSMGETAHDRIEMAMTLKELDVDSIPLNILNPIPGTRMENQEILSPEDILRALAVFRILLPDKVIRYAGGRESAMGEHEYEGYRAGVNALIAGSFLTTTGKNVKDEIKTLTRLGLVIDTEI